MSRTIGERLRGRSTAGDRGNLPNIMAVAEGWETAGVAVSGCVAAVAVGAAAGAFRRAVAGEASCATACQNVVSDVFRMR